MVGVEEGREFRFRGDLYSQESTFPPVNAVLFFSRLWSEGWPHHGRTFSIYPCPLSFWLTLPWGVVSINAILLLLIVWNVCWTLSVLLSGWLMPYRVLHDFAGHGRCHFPATRSSSGWAVLSAVCCMLDASHRIIVAPRNAGPCLVWVCTMSFRGHCRRTVSIGTASSTELPVIGIPCCICSMQTECFTSTVCRMIALNIFLASWQWVNVVWLHRWVCCRVQNFVLMIDIVVHVGSVLSGNSLRQTVNRVYDSRHRQADCQEPESAPESYTQ